MTHEQVTEHYLGICDDNCELCNNAVPQLPGWQKKGVENEPATSLYQCKPKDTAD